MSIEKQNFNLKATSKRSMLSDRENLIRSMPKQKYLTHEIVVNFIKNVVDDDIIREKLIKKLKNCPDGALQNFINTIEDKIAQVINEMSPKKENLPQKPSEVTIEDMIAMRNSISEQASKESKDDQG
jgi:hypothetical protein